MTDNNRAECHSYQGCYLEKRLTNEKTSIIGRLLEWAAIQPDEIYLTAVELDSIRETLTYGDLERLSRRLVGWFSNELRLQPGDIVALLAQNNLISVLTIFALLRSGCSIFFINPAEPKKRMEALLGEFQIKATLAPSPALAAQHNFAIAVPAPLTLGDELSAVSPVLPDVDTSAFFFATSGSTATSKIVIQTHYNAVVNAEALRQHHRLERGVSVLGCLPIHHVNGLHFTLLATLWSGARAILLKSFNLAYYQQCIHKLRPAIASVVPTILETLLTSCVDSKFPNEFRYFVSASAPLSTRTCASVLEKFGVRVLQGYGLTETTNFSTTIPDGLSESTYRRFAIDTNIPSIGIALYGNEVEVLRPDGTLAELGEIGEICMRGHNIMLGYANNEVATQEAFTNDWFHSQDLGYKLKDAETGHTFFFITGRLKNIAKVMGFAVSLEEIERTLLELPFVTDAACFSVPNQLLGETIIAVVVSAIALDSQMLNAHLKDYFNSAFLPNKYIQADVIPRTATGKIIRAQLSLLFGDTHEYTNL